MLIGRKVGSRGSSVVAGEGGGGLVGGGGREPEHGATSTGVRGGVAGGPGGLAPALHVAGDAAATTLDRVVIVGNEVVRCEAPEAGNWWWFENLRGRGGFRAFGWVEGSVPKGHPPSNEGIVGFEGVAIGLIVITAAKINAMLRSGEQRGREGLSRDGSVRRYVARRPIDLLGYGGDLLWLWEHTSTLASRGRRWTIELPGTSVIEGGAGGVKSWALALRSAGPPWTHQGEALCPYCEWHA